MSRSPEARDQFEQELVALLPRLRRFAFGLAGSRTDGDDLVQGALAKALTNRDQWQPGTRLDSWLYRIVQNHWIDTVRSRRSRGDAMSLDDAPEVVGDDGVRATENVLVLAKVNTALTALPEDQRVVLVMIGVEGMSYAAAAEALDVPIGTVMSRLARGRAALAMAVYGEPRKPR